MTTLDERIKQVRQATIDAKEAWEAFKSGECELERAKFEVIFGGGCSLAIPVIDELETENKRLREERDFILGCTYKPGTEMGSIRHHMEAIKRLRKAREALNDQE